MEELIKIDNDMALLEPDTAAKIVAIETTINKMKKMEEDLKKAILEEMESKNIIKLDNEIEGLTITYVASTDRETFDSKKFRADHEDLYDEYIKLSPVKASIRIKVKE